MPISLESRVSIAALVIKNHNPKLWNRVPVKLRNRMAAGDPTMLPELLTEMPELFRERSFANLEDEAFALLRSQSQ